MMKKKAFTFAELMISLVVISVLSAILYPMIAQFTPNSNKPLFKSAYRVLTDVLAELTANSTTGELDTTYTELNSNTNKNESKTGKKLCMDFCSKVNTIPDSVGDTCTTQCDDQIIITTNGMRWYFGDNGTYNDPIDGATANANVFQLFVDVNASNNNLSSVDHCSSLLDQTASPKGEFCYAPDETDMGIYAEMPSDANIDGSFNVAKLKAQDTFEILIDKKGKIITMSPAGWANLEDNLQAVD